MFSARPNSSASSTSSFSSSGSSPALTSSFHLGGCESLFLLSFSSHPSILRPPPFMSPCLPQASICPSPLSLYLPLKKQHAVKRSWLLLCELWPTVCAQRSVLHLLNPGAGSSSKGRLGSCKGPFSSPSLLTPFLWANRQRGGYSQHEDKAEPNGEQHVRLGRRRDKFFSSKKIASGSATFQ